MYSASDDLLGSMEHIAQKHGHYIPGFHLQGRFDCTAY